MSSLETRRALGRAFRELTLTLIGLFELHDADPELVQGAADALGKVFRAHLERHGGTARTPGRAAMQALLDELEAAAREAA